MDTKLLRRTAVNSMLFMFCMFLLSFYVTTEKNSIDLVMAMDETTMEREEPEEIIEPEEAPEPEEPQQPAFAPGENPELLELMGDRYLIIPKNDVEDTNAHVVVEEDYVYRTIVLKLDHADKLSWNSNSVDRFNEGERFTGEPDGEHLEQYMDEYLDEEPAGLDELEVQEGETPLGEAEPESKDLVQAVSVSYDEAGSTAAMSITLNHLYVPFLYEDEYSYYIDLKHPKEVYDKIVVIDAGHGGKHPGTMTKDKKLLEKTFNLDILLSLKDMLDKQDEIHVYYTRTDDSSVYLRPRVNLANEAEADFFISIHNNAYYNQYAYGTEVLYNELLQTDGAVSCARLAEICLEEVQGIIGTRNRGLRKSSETFILGHSEVPAALIEIGYITNPGDLALLQDPEQVDRMAEGIYRTIMRAYDELGETEKND